MDCPVVLYYLCAAMYYFIFGILYLISLLPFFILYGIADFLFVLIYLVPVSYTHLTLPTNREV